MSDIKFLENLASYFELLPGVGKKTAKRYAYSVVEKMSKDAVKEFADELVTVKNQIKNCSVCGMLTTLDTCEFCQSPLRDHSKIMVLKDTRDVLSIDATHQYNGLYHCLNGLISPVNGIGPEEINIDKLLERCDGTVDEVIIATPFTPDGETTAVYIEHILKNKNITSSRIGFGLPAGGDIEYVDELTLKRAINNRTKNE